MEVNETVLLSAVVEDQESTADKLAFVWSSPGGAFLGEGTQVNWQPSSDMTTPGNPVLTLTVVETYPGLTDQGKLATLEHRVSRSVSVRLHNSPRELGDMGVAFLQKFANSSISPEACLVDFSDSCSGKKSELGDIQRNRENFLILERSLGEPRVTSLTKYSRADVSISCSFGSKRVKCPSGSSGCVVGAIERVSGTCRLTAVYEQARWWLCDSRFSGSGLSPSMKLFFGSSL
jgi:hypothetical protein